jgi:hypothetical protein
MRTAAKPLKGRRRRPTVRTARVDISRASVYDLIRNGEFTGIIKVDSRLSIPPGDRRSPPLLTASRRRSALRSGGRRRLRRTRPPLSGVAASGAQAWRAKSAEGERRGGSFGRVASSPIRAPKRELARLPASWRAVVPAAGTHGERP